MTTRNLPWNDLATRIANRGHVSCWWFELAVLANKHQTRPNISKLVVKLVDFLDLQIGIKWLILATDGLYVDEKNVWDILG